MAMAGKVVKQLAGSGTGQSFVDRMNSAKYTITGSGVAKVVCKATTEEIVAPKTKHIDYLIQCTNEPNVSIPHLANLLIERSQQTSWVVVFKSLISIHNVMNYGNERFSQYLASNNCQISQPNFTDKSGVQAYDMSMFIRHYSKYVNEKAVTYRTMAFDFCKVKRGKDDGVLRTMLLDKLLKTLPGLQRQLDILLEFDATSNELSNNVVNVAFLLLYKDLIRLFATYNEGMINLIEKYFTMNKKQCREALDLYKKFLNRMERVNQFLKVAESLGCGDNDGLGLQTVPSSVLDALEQHLATLEGRKVSKSSSSESASSATNGGSTAVRTTAPSSYTAAPSSYTTAPTSYSTTSNSTSSAGGLSEVERARIIEDEKRTLAEFAAKKKNSGNSITTYSGSNNVTTTAPSSNMGSNSAAVSITAKSQAIKPSDDLLLLGLDSVSSSQAAPLADNNPFASTAPSNNAWNTFTSNTAQQPQQRLAIAQAPTQQDFGFATSFGNSQPTQATSQGFTSFGDILQPITSGPANSQPSTNQVRGGPSANTGTGPASLGSDLDSSLASLAGSLSVVGPGQLSKPEHKWNQSSPTMQQRTGGPQHSQPQSTGINWGVPGTGMNPAPMPIPPGTTYSYGQPVAVTPWPTFMRMQQPYPGMAPVGYQMANYPVSSMGNPSPMASQHTGFHGQSQNSGGPPQSVNDPFGAL